MSPFPRCVLALVTVLSLTACSGGDYQDVLRTLMEKERLVVQIRLNVLLAGEAGKSAVLATTEEAAGNFAAEARTNMRLVKENLATLTALIAQGHEAKEQAALSQLTEDIGQLDAVGAKVLGLAGRNTNLRASLLSHTEATQAVHRLRQALTPVIDGTDCAAAREALHAVMAGLTILALQDRHIDEAGDDGMRTLETDMGMENGLAVTALDRLAGLLPPDAPSVGKARLALADLWRITQTITQLSRENSNIHAQALVIGRARLILAKTVSDLQTLYAVVAAKNFTATR